MTVKFLSAEDFGYWQFTSRSKRRSEAYEDCNGDTQPGDRPGGEGRSFSPEYGQLCTSNAIRPWRYRVNVSSAVADVGDDVAVTGFLWYGIAANSAQCFS